MDIYACNVVHLTYIARVSISINNCISEILTVSQHEVPFVHALDITTILFQFYSMHQPRTVGIITWP